MARGDELETGSDGRVVIDISDGSQVILFPNARVVLGDYRNTG